MAFCAQVSSDDVLRMTQRHKPAAQYPGGKFGDGLRTVAAMIGGGLPTRVYYVSLGGFDTHANVIDVHVNRLRRTVDRDHARKLIHTVKGIGYVIEDRGPSLEREDEEPA